jgi:serine/threonine protein kinase
VFEAERLADGARFALKRVDRAQARDEVTVTRFAREVRAASAVQSEHIVRVLDVGTDEGCPYLVMDRLEGEDLGARLRRERHVREAEAIDIACQVLEGLEKAHAQGIIHRDLKPDNVFLVSAVRGPTLVKILDFGMSKMQPLGATVPLAVTLRGVAVGTPLYMSPEQAEARPDVDALSDVYSVGAMLFECLTGRPPHVGETDDAILTSIRTTRAPGIRQVAPRVGVPLAKIIDRALAMDRADRFESAGRMRRALQAMQGTTRIVLNKPASRTWVAALVALVVGIVVTVVAVLIVGAARR